MAGISEVRIYLTKFEPASPEDTSCLYGRFASFEIHPISKN